MRIFIAGASGVIGVRLVPLLVADGHTVAGMTRSSEKTSLLRELGAEPVVCEVFDADALTRAMIAFGPDVVFHQLTDLPDGADDISLPELECGGSPACVPAHPVRADGLLQRPGPVPVVKMLGMHRCFPITPPPRS